jgi:Tol biopolymer transport system component
MEKKRIALISYCLLGALLLSLALAACGGAEPTPTASPSDTPLPVGTLRPTYTPTVLARATKEPTPTGEPTKAQPQSDATDVAADQTAEPSPTPTEETPVATRAVGPAPRLSGQLFFPVFDTAAQTYDIYRLDLASGQMAQFIEQGSQPAITPGGDDGPRIAWRSWKQDQRGLLSRTLDGSDTWPMITFTEAARPDWSPDGQRFVFPSRQEPDRESRLYLFTGVGDEPFVEIQRHGSPIVGRTPAFLPDGRIVYQGCVENACGLFLMNADGTNPQQITLSKDDTAPAISPDGTRIAYMSFSSDYWQVNLVNVDGSEQRHLTEDWYWNGLPTWSPDGKYLVFVSNRDENWPDTFAPSKSTKFRLWIMDADGQNQQQLNDFSFQMDGVPAGVPGHETAGWIEERMVWLPEK